MVVVAQLVRALDCGSRGRRFETGLPPHKAFEEIRRLFYFHDPSSLEVIRNKKYTTRSVEAL